MSTARPILPDYANQEKYAASHAASKKADLKKHIKSIEAAQAAYDAALKQRQFNEDNEPKYRMLMKRRIATGDTPTAPVAANRMTFPLSKEKLNGGKSKRHFKSKSKSKSKSRSKKSYRRR
jgi:hypothetical protein